MFISTINPEDNTGLSSSSSSSSTEPLLPTPSFPSIENVSKVIQLRSIQVSNYPELVKNIEGSELEGLNQILDQMGDCKAEIKRLRHAMKHHEWKDSIFDNQNLFPYYGLKAVKNGQLSNEQFTTLMIYWSIRQHHEKEDIQIISLFNQDGTPNQEALLIIQKPISHYSFENDWFNKEHTIEFLELMKNKPLSELSFFVIPNLQSIFEENDPLRLTVSQAILKGGNLTLFSYLIDPQTKKESRILPSLGMMQAALDTKFKENGVKINPILGLGSLINIENNGLTHSREMSLPFPNVFYPREADYFLVPQEYDFIMHDFYHAFIASYIPKNHQKAIILIAQTVNHIIKNKMLQKTEENLINYDILSSQFYETLIDMEFQEYRMTQNEMKELIFLNALYNVVIKSELKFLQGLTFKISQEDEFKGKSYEAEITNEANKRLTKITNPSSWKTLFIPLLAKEIVAKKNEFQSIGINFESDAFKEANKKHISLYNKRRNRFQIFLNEEISDPLNTNLAVQIMNLVNSNQITTE